jgi:hypothetical protein
MAKEHSAISIPSLKLNNDVTVLYNAVYQGIQFLLLIVLFNHSIRTVYQNYQEPEAALFLFWLGLLFFSSLAILILS